MSNASIILKAAEEAIRAVPPVWPLSSSVAVNPFLGQSGTSLAQTAALYERVAGMKVTMERDWYATRIEKGEITEADLEDACRANIHEGHSFSPADLKAAAQVPSATAKVVPTIAELAIGHIAIECAELVTERISFWAAGYFDRGQALWGAPHEESAYLNWRSFATRDLSPEILGVRDFAPFVDKTPETALGAIQRAVQTLQLPDAALATYFHSLLMTLGGWAQLARHKLWEAELAGDTDDTLLDLLAIRLVWEEAFYTLCEAEIAEDWASVCNTHAMPLSPSPDQIIDSLLQEAAERAEQRKLAECLSTTEETPKGRPAVQAAFCIDVRSEVFRRALESTSPNIQTMGFAGFFGLPTQHHGAASDTRELRLPVLLNPQLKSRTEYDEDADLAARYLARAKRAWGRFKLAAVSSFAFVEAAGPIYVGKLLRDSFALVKHTGHDAPKPVFDESFDLSARIKTAGAILRAMSLTDNFAPIVLVTGHGASVVNNPHASALQCGACGGYSGEVNARLLAGLLNEPEVRKGLDASGITIPADTWFVGALHDTTTDKVTVFDNDTPSPGHAAQLKQIRQWLDDAARLAITERAVRLPRATGPSDILRRSKDWSEVRPEWGLAGCKAFIVSPRIRTTGKNLEGRAFLHDYDWRQDQNFSVLELIMTAPVVVASWINLQYYGSTVMPDAYGGGNKLLHNVTGGVGVIEGNGGLLRAGLPWQSVHNGTEYMHDPLRLTVCIEAPRDAMTDILKKYDNVRALFDNRWLHLFALDDNGAMAWRYGGDLNWVAVNADDVPAAKQFA